jgi:anti-sigma B factor antagonist
MILSVARRQIPPDIVVLEMTGRIVLGNNSRDVELKLAEILADPANKKIIFDLSGISVLDSTGIGILVVSQGKINKAGASLRIAGATGFVEDTLKITSVDKLIQLYRTAVEAAASF